MQYFVSIENTSYFYWQTELLLESFLMQNMQDDLIIGIAENDIPKLSKFSHNLVNHPNIFFHSNEGEKNEYKSLNRFYGLLAALTDGRLKCPFTLVHSDMILVKPVEEKEENLVFHPLYDDTVDSMTKPYIKEMAEIGGVTVEDLPSHIPFNGPIVFQDVPIELIWRAKNRTEVLLKENGPTFPCEKVGWSLAFYEMLSSVAYGGEYMECSLIDPMSELNVNFVHYKHGIPPVFHKRHFTWDKPNLSGINPYEVLLEHNPTPATNFVQKVIRSYNKRAY